MWHTSSGFVLKFLNFWIMLLMLQDSDFSPAVLSAAPPILYKYIKYVWMAAATHETALANSSGIIIVPTPNCAHLLSFTVHWASMKESRCVKWANRVLPTPVEPVLPVVREETVRQHEPSLLVALNVVGPFLEPASELFRANLPIGHGLTLLRLLTATCAPKNSSQRQLAASVSTHDA